MYGITLNVDKTLLDNVRIFAVVVPTIQMNNADMGVDYVTGAAISLARLSGNDNTTHLDFKTSLAPHQFLYGTPVVMDVMRARTKTRSRKHRPPVNQVADFDDLLLGAVEALESGTMKGGKMENAKTTNKSYKALARNHRFVVLPHWSWAAVLTARGENPAGSYVGASCMSFSDSETVTFMNLNRSKPMGRHDRTETENDRLFTCEAYDDWLRTTMIGQLLYKPSPGKVEHVF
jgi:hypothetical protein